MTDQICWEERVFNDFPPVIAHEYQRMHSMWEENEFLPLPLKIRDTIEAITKHVCLSACAWGKAAYPEMERAYEVHLVNKALSLGDWSTLIVYIRRFYGLTHGNPYNMPMPLVRLLKNVPQWLETNKLVSWRNEIIGHGSLGYIGSEFMHDLVEKVNLITVFLQNNLLDFVHQMMLIRYSNDNEKVLLGYGEIWDNSEETGNLFLHINDNGIEKTFPLSPFMIYEKEQVFFFDSYRSKAGDTRMLCYPTGAQMLVDEKFFNSIYVALSYSQRMKTIPSRMIDRSISRAIDRLSSSSALKNSFVVPEYLLQWIRYITDPSVNSRGVFLLQMQQGCGKTVFSEKLNTLYENPLFVDEDMQVRTYHFSRSQSTGLYEFEMALKDMWGAKFDSTEGAIVEYDRAISIWSSVKISDRIK